MFRKFALLMVAVMLVAAGFGAGTAVVSINAAPVEQNLSQPEQVMASVYNLVSPSVVAISVSTGQGGGSGSGFVIDKSGNIVTNYHVVENASDIVVNFLDGTITRATVVGLDPDSDIAVIRVNLPQERLFPVQFGSSDNLVIGQTVLAIGSPFGERWTLTSGIVSALNRTIQGLNAGFSIGAVIQTDAAINPGNSGGPLLNLQGQVVGVNSQIRTESGSSSGIGYAIPSVLVQRVANELILNGSVDYSLIGIEGTSISLGVIEALGLSNNQRGVVISRVVEGGPAASAGLRSAQANQRSQLVSADIITAINGTFLDNGMDGLVAYLARYTKPGDVVTLSIIRDGQTLQVSVTLGSRRGQ